MRYVTRYRIYPDKETENRLFSAFDKCTYVRNWCLDNNTFSDSILPKLKQEHPELKEVHSKVLQNIVHQISYNLKGLAKLKEKGRKVGKLRTKRVHSMIYEQSGFKIFDGILSLSKIGVMPIVLSRPIRGKIKQIIVKHNKTHKWFVSIVSETSDTPVKTNGIRSVGIDLNLDNFSTDSDGKVVANPRKLRSSEKRLRRAQRKMSKKVKKSKNRKKQRLVLAKSHERVKNQRDDFLHKWSRYYVDNYDHIVMEDLNIENMVSHNLRGLNKSIYDAGWRRARYFITYKAESAGKYVYFVNPAYTSQDCFNCGNRVKKTLSDRNHHCQKCGYSVSRDFNASQNILKRACIGWDTPELTLAEIETSTPSQIGASFSH